MEKKGRAGETENDAVGYQKGAKDEESEGLRRLDTVNSSAKRCSRNTHHRKPTKGNTDEVMKGGR